MTPPLTPQQKVERLAEFMGYDCMSGKWNEDAEAYEYVWFDNYSGEPHENVELWNPYTDENHFHQCLIEVMKDEKLLEKYCSMWWEETDRPYDYCLERYICSDLPARVDKLIEALNSLPSE